MQLAARALTALRCALAWEANPTTTAYRSVVAPRRHWKHSDSESFVRGVTIPCWIFQCKPATHRPGLAMRVDRVLAHLDEFVGYRFKGHPDMLGFDFPEYDQLGLLELHLFEPLSGWLADGAERPLPDRLRMWPE